MQQRLQRVLATPLVRQAVRRFRGDRIRRRNNRLPRSMLYIAPTAPALLQSSPPSEDRAWKKHSQRATASQTPTSLPSEPGLAAPSAQHDSHVFDGRQLNIYMKRRLKRALAKQIARNAVRRFRGDRIWRRNNRLPSSMLCIAPTVLAMLRSSPSSEERA